MHIIELIVGQNLQNFNFSKNKLHLRLMDKGSNIEDAYKLHTFSYTIIIKIIFSYMSGVHQENNGFLH